MRRPLRAVNRRIDWWGLGRNESTPIHKECPLDWDFSDDTTKFDTGCSIFNSGVGNDHFSFDSVYYFFSTTQPIFDSEGQWVATPSTWNGLGAFWDGNLATWGHYA